MKKFEEYKKYRDMPLKERASKLHEKRKYMPVDSTIRGDVIPVPEEVINVLNMIPAKYRTRVLRWIMTEGVRMASFKRRNLVNQLKKHGINTDQPSVFSKNAHKSTKELADNSDKISRAWEDIDGEPEVIDIRTPEGGFKINLADINARLIQKGMKPLMFGGFDGLMEYIEGGSWNDSAIHSDPEWGKYGHDLSLPDDPKNTGKKTVQDTDMDIFKLGTAQGGGYVQTSNPKYWSEYLNKAQIKTKRKIDDIIQRVQNGEDVPEKNIKWIQSMLDDDGNLKQDSYENKLFDPIETQYYMRGYEKGEEGIPFNQTTSTEDLAKTKAAIKVWVDQLFDMTGFQPDGSSTKQDSAMGLSQNHPYEKTVVKTRLGSVEIPKDANLSDPRVRQGLVDQISDIMIDDEGNFGLRMVVTKSGGGNKVKHRNAMVGAKLRGKEGKMAFEKAAEDGKNINVKVNGQDFDFGPDDIVDIAKSGKRTVRKISRRAYKPENEIMDYSDSEEIPVEDIQKMIQQGYSPEYVGDGQKHMKLSKGNKEVLLRRKFDSQENKDKWYKVPVTQTSRDDHPLMGGSLDFRVNTIAGQDPAMRFGNKAKQRAAWDDYQYNPESFGEKSWTKVEDNDVPSVVADAVRAVSGAEWAPSDNSWKGDASQAAMKRLQNLVADVRFKFGDLEYFLLPSNLGKAGLDEDQQKELISLLQNKLMKTKEGVVEADIDGFEDDGGPLKVSSEIYQALMKNGYHWRKRQSKAAISTYLSRNKKLDRASGEGGQTDDEDRQRTIADLVASQNDDDQDWGGDWEDDFYGDDDDEDVKRSFGGGRNDDDEMIGQLSQGDLDQLFGFTYGSDEEKSKEDDWSKRNKFKKSQIDSDSGYANDLQNRDFSWGRTVSNPVNAPTAVATQPQTQQQQAVPSKVDQIRADRKQRKTVEQIRAERKQRRNESVLKSYSQWLAEQEVVFDPKAATKKNRTFNTWGAPIKGKSIPTKVIDGDADTSKTDPVGKK